MARHHVGRSRLAAVTLVLALAAAACGSDDSSSASGRETLASFMGWEGDDEDDADMEAQWRDQDARMQELIRDCMAEQGFEYLPVDHNQGSYTVYDEGDEEERIRTQGFGITTWYGNEEMFEEPVEDVEWHDPNEEIVESMSDSEREAYYEALWGNEDEMMENAIIEYDDETGEEIGYSYEGFGSGCQGQAEQEVWGGGSDSDTQELWEELEPAFEAMYERVQADPRIVEWNEAWSRCMAEAGHDYDSPDTMHNEVWEDFDQRLQEILGPDGGWVDPFEGWSEAETEAFFNERSDEEIDAFFEAANQQQSENVDQDALAALQQEEIDLAVADLECRDGDEFWEVYQEVSESYEADLIAENRELLERLREAEGR